MELYLSCLRDLNDSQSRPFYLFEGVLFSSINGLLLPAVYQHPVIKENAGFLVQLIIAPGVSKIDKFHLLIPIIHTNRTFTELPLITTFSQTFQNQGQARYFAVL